MIFGEYISQIRDSYSTYGAVTGSHLAASKTVERLLTHVGSKLNYGSKPLEHEWDVMIILDACRADLFQEYAPRHDIYERFETVSSTYSCASTSHEWFEKGFGPEVGDISDVHYVTQNPHLARLDCTRFNAVEPLWTVKGDDTTGLVDPQIVTNVALEAYARSEADRFIVHYMPPHAPFLHCPDRYRSPDRPWGDDVWFGLQIGRFDKREVWNDYGRNLLRALDEVQRLIRHVSGDVVVTADHANGIGELGIYGHPEYVPVPAVKAVPWAKATGLGIDYDASDLPNVASLAEADIGVEGRMEALGYL